MTTLRQTTSAAMDPRAVRWIRVRVSLLALAFVPLALGLVYRAVTLQVLESQKLGSLAKDQYLREVTLSGKRGEIFDRRGAPLAASVDVDSVYLDPTELADPRKAAADVARAIKGDAKKLTELFTSGRHFAWVKRRATPQEVLAVKALKLPGVGTVKESRRFYPERELAAHVVGTSSLDGNGIEGVELSYNALLQGKPQPLMGLRDARGQALMLDRPVQTEELSGASVTLTLDKAIQYQAEKALAAAVTSAQAASGTAVVLDPLTGELLALANVPTYNPNDAGRYKKDALRNRAATDQFEPGSTFKIFTIAAALEEKAVKPTTVFDTEHGSYKIGKHTIHDHGGHDALDVAHILQVSSNVGAAKIGEKLGKEKLHQYHQLFGFGDKPGTGLPGEARGSVPFPKADIAAATQSFGQGVTASAVQLAAAVGAVANGGVLMRPYVVSRIVDADGAILLDQGPEKVRQVVSRQTAAEVLKMMRLVVEKEGTAPLARMDDYNVAGKTGTAQKADPVTGGYGEKRTASFVGVVPAEAPRLVILVVIDEPKTDVYGGLVAAPAFKEIAQGALAHLGVPPSNALAPKVAQAQPEDGAAFRTDKPLLSASKLASAFNAAQIADLRRDEPADAQDDGLPADIGEDAPDGETVVPDVSGLTARSAVKALAAANLEPALSGSGKATGQTPPAGTQVKRGARVAVKLESKM